MSLDIKNLSHVEQDVGQHIKSTKKHFIWDFLLDGKPHRIELYDSKLSGKKKLIKDGQVWKEVEDNLAFSKSFEIGKHSCTIIQHGDKYELRIDNQSFGHLMDLEKNKVFFSGESTPTSNTYQSKPNPTNTNKIGFGLGAINFQPKENQTTKQNGMFNFSIKPVQNGQKRNSEMPAHEFDMNKFGSKVESKTSKNNNPGNNNLLIDFGAPTESKVSNNNQDLFDQINFNIGSTVNTSNNNFENNSNGNSFVNNSTNKNDLIVNNGNILNNNIYNSSQNYVNLNSNISNTLNTLNTMNTNNNLNMMNPNYGYNTNQGNFMYPQFDNSGNGNGNGIGIGNNNGNAVAGQFSTQPATNNKNKNDPLADLFG